MDRGSDDIDPLVNPVQTYCLGAINLTFWTKEKLELDRRSPPGVIFRMIIAEDRDTVKGNLGILQLTAVEPGGRNG